MRRAGARKNLRSTSRRSAPPTNPPAPPPAPVGGPTVFTLALNSSTGAYTFTLSAHLDHAAGAGENNLVIDFSSLVTATDSDGDSVGANASGLSVTVVDDVPSATATVLTGSVDEDGVAGANGLPGDVLGVGTTATGSVASLFHAGAD